MLANDFPSQPEVVVTSIMKLRCTVLAFAAACGLTHATTINAPSMLTGNDALSGEDAYSWGVSINLQPGQTIQSASITFSDITLTAANSSGTGYLYTDLLNSSKTGVHSFNDGDVSGDYFKTRGSGFASA